MAAAKEKAAGGSARPARARRAAELRARCLESFAVARYLKGSSAAELAELLGVIAAECARRGIVLPLPLAAYTKLEAAR